MKTVNTYEKFSELADAMCDGEGMLHTHHCPGSDECLAWQRGVRDLAGWLDHIGAKVNIQDKAEGFYDFMREKTAREAVWQAELDAKYAERRKERLRARTERNPSDCAQKVTDTDLQRDESVWVDPYGLKGL